MIDFLKNFLDDEKAVVGLCAFNKENQRKTPAEQNFFYAFEMQRRFTPQVKNNILLI